MSTTEIFDQISLSEAAYADFIGFDINSTKTEIINVLLNVEDGFSQSQAVEFANHWRVVNHLPDTGLFSFGSGFSATLFESIDNPGEYTFAIRGTAGGKDLIIADATDIVLDGIALDQVVDMYNYWQRLTAPEGQHYQVAKLVPALELSAQLALAYLQGQDVGDAFAATLGQQPGIIIDRFSLGVVKVVAYETSAEPNGLGLILQDLSGINVTGHSLGGHLAMAFTRLFSEFNPTAYTVNGAGFSSNFNVDNLLNALAGKETLFDDNRIINMYGTAGPNFVTQDIFFGLIQEGTRIPLFTESTFKGTFGLGTTLGHGVGQMTDSAVAYDLLITLDSSLQALPPLEAINQLTPLFEAASNKADFSVEILVNSLGKLLVSDFNEINKSGEDNRETLYSRINDIRDVIFIDPEVPSLGLNPLYQGLTITSLMVMNGGELTSIDTATLISNAQTSIAYRYALQQLNPFVIEGNDTLYIDNHNQNGELDLFDPVTGAGTLTEDYLNDRAQFLHARIAMFLEDTRNKNITSENITYKDVASGLVLHDLGNSGGAAQLPGRLFTFGDENNNVINGASKDDHLYGGGGDDRLKGNAGDDHMEGNQGEDELIGGLGGDTLVGGDGNDVLWSNDNEANDDNVVDTLEGGKGFDTYFAGVGDIIKDDATGEGQIHFEGEFLRRGYRDPATDPVGEYKDASGKYLYTLIGTTLTASLIADPNKKITINNFTPGQLGIDLLDQPPVLYQFDGTAGDDFIIDTAGDPPGSHIEIANGSKGEVFPEPVQRIEGKGGNDTISINADIPNLVIYGDSAGADPGTDGNDIIEADRLRANSTSVPDSSNGVEIHGEGGNDEILASQRDDVITGDGGHDLIHGQFGKDTINGGTGNDLIEGERSRDVISGDAGNDHLLGGEQNDVLFGGEGNDWLYGDAETNGFLWDGDNEQYLKIPILNYFDDAQAGQPIQVFGYVGDVDITEHSNDALYGGSGDDKLFGGGETDYLFGEGDNDHLEGEAGDDFLFGGGGQDNLWGDIDPVTFDNNTTFISGESIDYTTYIADFVLRTYTQDRDVIGNDELNGGAGYDNLYGGGGDDSYVLDFNYDTDIVVDSSGTADKVRIASGITEGQIIISSVGGDVLVTLLDEIGQYNSQLILSDWAGNGKIESIEFADGTVWGSAAIEEKAGIDIVSDGIPIDAYFSLSGGDDQSQGQNINEAIYAFEGNDLIQAGGGSDRVFGGPGNDTLLGQTGNDLLYGGDGDDLLQGGNNDDQLSGGAGIDQLFGESGNDTLQGNAGDDTLQGGTGNDTYLFNIGDGNDLIFESTDAQLDVLRFGEGITPDDILITQNVGRLAVSHINGMDKVEIANWFAGPEFKLDHFEFSDGTMWDVTTIESLLPDAYTLTNGLTNGGAGPTTYTLDVDAPDGFAITIDDASGIDQLNFVTLIYFSDPVNNIFLTKTPTLDDLQRVGDDLVLSVSIDDSFTPAPIDANGTVTMCNFYTDNGYIETITFPVGQVLGQPNNAPVLNGTITDQLIALDTPYNFTLPSGLFFDDVIDLLSIEATLIDGSPLPTWLSFDLNTLTFSGTPTTGGSEVLEIQVTASDREGLSAQTDFHLGVGDINIRPQTNPDTVVVDEDVTTVILSVDLLANDSDLNNDTLTIIAVGNETNGTTSMDVNGNIVFTSAQDFSGLATFDYAVTDNNGLFSIETVSVNVNPVNDAPMAMLDNFEFVLKPGSEKKIVAGPEFMVNTTTTLDQTDVRIAGLTGGGFVTVWAHQNSSTDRDIYGQIYDANGNKVNSEFQVNTHVNNQQLLPDVTALSDGGFIVTWAGNDPATGDSSDLGISGQRFDANGDMMGSEFLINTNTDNRQTLSGVAALANGGFVVTWTNSDQISGDGSGASIAAQVYAADGSTVGGEILVNTNNTLQQIDSSIATLTGGGFVITWQSNDAPGDSAGWGISAQLFDNSGNNLGSEFLVNTDTNASQIFPVITTLSDGGFVIAWLWDEATPSGTQNYISAGIFDANGTKTGSEISIPINSTTTDYTDLTGIENNQFIITWVNDNDILGQVFDDQGNKIGEEFTVSQTADAPSITNLKDGGFAVAYVDGGTKPDIAARIFHFEQTNAVSIGVLANDTDVDPGDSPLNFTLESVTLQGGLGEVSIVDNQLVFDVKSDFDFLNTGETTDVIVDYTMSDNDGLSSSSTVTITVTGINDAPVIANPLADQTTDEDVLFTYTIPANTFSDPDNGDSIVTYNAALSDGNPLPAWLGFDAIHLNFSGMPTNDEVGSIDIEITATDMAGNNVSDSFRLTVNNTNDAPVIQISLIDQTADVDASFNYVIPANSFMDVDVGDSLTYSALLADGNPLPAWLSFDENSLLFSGTPGLIDRGIISVEVKASDISGAFNIDIFDLTVNFISIIGDDGDNVLNGTAVSELLDGGAGNDTLFGAGGNDLLLGGEGNDLVNGDDGNDTLAGGMGNDMLTGGMGNDTYLFGEGDGNDTIIENGNTNGSNVIHFVDNLSIADIQIEYAGKDLVFTLKETGESISFKQWKSGKNVYPIIVEYGDGTILTQDDLNIKQKLGDEGNNTVRGSRVSDRLYGFTGNDLVLAKDGDDFIDGGAGDDQLEGMSGNDVYLFSTVWGNDVIIENDIENDPSSGNFDTVFFGSGLQPLDLTFSQSGNDLLVSRFDSSDSVTIRDWFLGVEYQTEVFKTSDGSALLNTQVDQLIQAMSTFTSETGIDWSSLVQQQPEQVESILAASWQPV